MSLKNFGASIMRILVAGAGIIVLILASISPSFAETQWNVGISGGNDGIEGFHLSVGEYYRVPHKEVIVVHQRGICDEELPVVFYIAQRAHVHPNTVTRLRLRGMSWMDITMHFGLAPDIYYVPVRHVYNHHGHDYGYYRDGRPHNWKKMHLKDRDIINQVNLKFISEHRGYAPEKVIRDRAEGKRFTEINRGGNTDKKGKSAYTDRREKSKQPASKGNTKYWKEDKRQEKNNGNGRDGRRGNS
jgi:hypothetical protein